MEQGRRARHGGRCTSTSHLQNKQHSLCVTDLRYFDRLEYGRNRPGRSKIRRAPQWSTLGQYFWLILKGGLLTFTKQNDSKMRPSKADKSSSQKGLVSTDRNMKLLYGVRHPDSKPSRLQVILHLCIPWGGYRPRLPS